MKREDSIVSDLSCWAVMAVFVAGLAVLAMRLHALIYAALMGVPMIGVSYDPKVTAFLDYIEQDNDIAEVQDRQSIKEEKAIPFLEL